MRKAQATHRMEASNTCTVALTSNDSSRAAQCTAAAASALRFITWRRVFSARAPPRSTATVSVTPATDSSWRFVHGV